jgi:hypothetical protein
MRRRRGARASLAGRPVIETSELYYDGNSQGGIEPNGSVQNVCGGRPCHS